MIATALIDSPLSSLMDADKIQSLVGRAADIVAPVWPLKNFIAVNPLQGLESLPFEKAVAQAHRFRSANQGLSNGREAVNLELIKWCSAYFDEGQATLAMPDRELGFYGAFRSLAPYDRRLRPVSMREWNLELLPESPALAIAESLERLNLPESQAEEFLRQSLASLPGWAGYVKWKEQWQDADEHAKRPASMVDFVAVRLVLTCLLWPDASVVKPPASTTLPFLDDMRAREAKFQKDLLSKLAPARKNAPQSDTARPDAQLVFCIDVRSEPFRRAIESTGAYQTLGFAGFFGLPIRIKEHDDDQPHDSCPVLLKPAHTVCCEPSSATDAAHVRRHDLGRGMLKTPDSFYQWLKYNFATPFALVEVLGPWLGAKMVAQTVAPTLGTQLSQPARRFIAPDIDTHPSLVGITPEKRADYAEGALRMMGLTANLAPLVVFCAHGSSTTNNPYASALDCGACGGNHGGGNARTLAAILNHSDVRAALATRGLAIPSDTLFLAAEHNTTTDHVEIFEPHDLPLEVQPNVSRLRDDLAQARQLNASVRTKAFGLPRQDNAVAETHRRSADWAEVRPEWGLARNAAFIVGPRELTRQIDLEGRCFLHSYNWQSDPNGKFLTTILTAPMVVAQWINSQYLFSTLDNVNYGAGSKVTHNVTGKLGVMQGNASDLMHGLPLQSVYAKDSEPYHEPQRLLTVVYAPRAVLDGIIQSQDVLKRLFGNGWVAMACIDPNSGQVAWLNRDLTWSVDTHE